MIEYVPKDGILETASSTGPDGNRIVDSMVYDAGSCFKTHALC